MNFAFKFSLPVVCITFHGRSGSFLLQGLLDSHPEVMTAPFHTLADMSNLVLDPGIYQQGGDIPGLVDRLAERFPYLFAEADHSVIYREAGAHMKIGVPRAEFMSILEQILASIAPRHLEPGILFRALHYAYQLALGRDANKAKVIIWQKHAPFFEEDRKELFARLVGNVKFLTPVRRPDVTLSSYFHHKHFHADTKSKIREVHQLLWLLRIAAYVPKSTSIDCVAVRFEDLHARTEEVTHSLATWLGLEWDPILLEPTLDGEEQLFPKDGTVVKGLNKNIERTQKSPHFTWLDRLIFEAINSVSYKRWGYTTTVKSESLNRIIAKLGKHVPMKMEVVKFFIDRKEGDSFKQAFAKAKERRNRVRDELQLLMDIGDGKTDLKMIPLLP